MARAGGSPSPQVAAITMSFFTLASDASSRSAMSRSDGLKPSLRALLATSPASFSELPDSVAYRIVSGSAACAATAGCTFAAAPEDASRPARKPASQARCIGGGRADDAIEDLDLVVGERCGFRNG